MPASNRWSIAWRLEECGDDALADLAARHEVPTTQLEAHLREGTCLSATLDDLNAFQLLLIESVIDMGGIARSRVAWGEACRRAGVNRPFDVDELRFAFEMIGTLLDFVLRNSASPRSPGFDLGGHDDEPQLVAVLEPCFDRLRDLVCGVSLPELPDGLDLEQTGALQHGEHLRGLLVASARLAQARVKSTKAGLPSRANRRRFEGDVALATGSLWELLEQAVELDLCSADAGGRVVPNVAAMRSLARGERVCLRGWRDHATTDATWITSRLRAGPASREELVRVLARAQRRMRAPRRPKMTFPFGRGPVNHAEIEQRLDAALGVWRAQVDGVDVFALPPKTLSRPCGHVLPNFDILLEPHAPLGVVVEVALAAELVRLDRVATFRLTPESVASGIAAGASCEGLIEALSVVGSHGVPEAVERATREWAAKVARARVLRRRVVVVPEPVATRLLADSKHGAAFEAIAPTVVAVDDALTETRLHDCLLAAGAQPESPPLALDEGGDEAGDEGDVALDVSQPDELLQMSIRAAIRDRDFPPFELFDGHLPPPPGVDPQAFHDAMVRAGEVLKTWYAELPVAARQKFDLDEFATSTWVLPLLALIRNAETKRILRRSTKPQQVIRRLRNAFNERKLAPFAAHIHNFELPGEPSGPTSPGPGPAPITSGPSSPGRRPAPVSAPEPSQFPSLIPRHTREALEVAQGRGQPLRLLVARNGERSVTPPLVIERLEARGRDIVVLTHMLGQDDMAMAFPLTDVGSVLPA